MKKALLLISFLNLLPRLAFSFEISLKSQLRKLVSTPIAAQIVHDKLRLEKVKESLKVNCLNKLMQEVQAHELQGHLVKALNVSDNFNVYLFKEANTGDNLGLICEGEIIYNEAAKTKPRKKDEII